MKPDKISRLSAWLRSVISSPPVLLVPAGMPSFALDETEDAPLTGLRSVDSTASALTEPTVRGWVSPSAVRKSPKSPP